MKKLALLFVHLFSLVCFSQTKLISHKSHSGSASDFRIAMKEGLFDIGDSNLGDVPYRTVVNASLDTVVYVSKGKSVMITSEHCKRVMKRAKDDGEGESTLWKAGRDTVFNHPLFSKNHSLDSIRMVLKNEYHFENDMDKVVFIGFDNKIKKYKKENRKRKKSGFFVFDAGSGFPPKFIFILALSFISGLVVYFTRKANSLEKALAQ